VSWGTSQCDEDEEDAIGIEEKSTKIGKIEEIERGDEQRSRDDEERSRDEEEEQRVDVEQARTTLRHSRSFKTDN
jgi:hypothetical protein